MTASEAPLAGKMNQAVFVKNLESWVGDAKLYKMLPPLVATDY